MKKVVIYTSKSCAFCHEAKEYFKENNIDFTEFDTSENVDARKELIRKGYRSVPIIIIDDQAIVGFNKSEIIELLQS